MERRNFLKNTMAVSAYSMVKPDIALDSNVGEAIPNSCNENAEIDFNRKWAEEAFSKRFPFSFVYGGLNSSEFPERMEEPGK